MKILNENKIIRTYTAVVPVILEASVVNQLFREESALSSREGKEKTAMELSSQPHHKNEAVSRVTTAAQDTFSTLQNTEIPFAYA